MRQSLSLKNVFALAWHDFLERASSALGNSFATFSIDSRPHVCSDLSSGKKAGSLSFSTELALVKKAGIYSQILTHLPQISVASSKNSSETRHGCHINAIIFLNTGMFRSAVERSVLFAFGYTSTVPLTLVLFSV